MISEKYTTIFLFDAIQPKKLLLLKRGPNRKFAPNLYTGLGGKVEDGEKQQQCAIRELHEEASLTNIQLTEFARLVINGTKVLYQFFGVYPEESTPDCSEGQLEWVPLEQVFSKDIIPTARMFLSEWCNRNWSTRPFTMLLNRENLEDIFSKIISQEVNEGLEH